MDEKLKDIEPVKKKRKKHWLLKIIYFFVSVFIVIDLFLFFLATPILKSYVQNKVYESTKGLFKIDFDRISIELGTRRLALEKFELIADTAVYNKLLKENKTSAALYNISCSSIELWGLGIYRLFINNHLTAKELKLIDPIIELKKLPTRDSTKTESRDFVHEDLYPAISDYISEVKIKLVNLENGKFFLQLNREINSNSTHIGYISVKLYDFLLNKTEHLKRDKLFFSNDLQIEITDYKVNLNDKIHYIFANSVNISSRQSRLTARNIGMFPLNESINYLNAVNNNYYKLISPTIEFHNFNIYQLYFKNDINIGEITIQKPSIDIVNRLKKDKIKTNRYSESMEIDLSKLIAGKLNSIAVDTIKVENGNLKFYYNNWKQLPVYKAQQFSLRLSNFDLRDQSIDIQTKIFYSDSLRFKIDTFIARLPDNAHLLSVNAIDISTHNKTIEARGLNLRHYGKISLHNQLNINIPKLKIAGADFLNLYHKRVLYLANLSIGPSNFDIKILGKEKDENDSIPKKNPFSIITTNFVKQLSIRNFQLSNSNFKLSRVSNDSTRINYQGNANFELKRFLITPQILLANDGNLFYADQFRLKLSNYSQDLKDNIHLLEAQTLEISNIDSIIEITGFNIKPKNILLTNNVKRSPHKIYNIHLIQASVKGIDIEKVYNDSSLIANTISLLRPEIRILNYFQNKKPKLNKIANDSISQIHPLIKDSIQIAGKNSFGNLRSMIASFFEKIDVNALNIEQANVSLIDIDSTGNRDLAMSGKLSVKFNKFYFNPNSQLTNEQISYSDNISFRLSDYFGKIFNKNYLLKIKQARFSSKDSVFTALLVRLFPTNSYSSSPHAKQLLNFYSPKIETRSTKISDLIDFNSLNIGKLMIENPSMALVQKKGETDSTKTTSRNQLRETRIKHVRFDEIKINKGVFGILKDDFNFERLITNADLSLTIRNLDIDTSVFSNPLQILPKLDAHINLSNIHHQLPDSLHFIDIGKIELNTKQKQLKGEKLKYYLEGTVNKTDQNLVLETFSIPEFSFTELGIDDFFINKSLKSNELTIYQPQIHLTSDKGKRGNKPFKILELKLYNKLNGRLNWVDINKLKVNDASISVKRRDIFYDKGISYDKIFANITDLLIDSAHQNDGRILNADDVSIMKKDLDFDFADSVYHLNIKEIRLSTKQQSLFANSIYLSPNLGRQEYADKKQKEINLNYVKSDGVIASGVDMNQLFDNQNFIMNNLDINKTQFLTYKYKQYPLDSILRSPLPLKKIWESKQLFKIDTVKISNAYIAHEILGKNSTENGFIDFTNINGEILNLTNDKKAIERKEETVIKASGYLMDKSLLTASFHFPIASKEGEYFYGGSLDTFDMTSINPLLENLFFVSIENGTINSINFNINANDDFSEGKLKMLYNDLKLELISKKKSDSLIVDKRGLFSMVANSIVRDNNPKFKKGIAKDGRVYFERDVYKPVFSYWIKSILSGMQSTLGFKSKQLKERLKIEKSSDKYQKKYARKHEHTDKKTTKSYEKQIEQELKDQEKNRRKEERKKKKEDKKAISHIEFIKPDDKLEIFMEYV